MLRRQLSHYSPHWLKITERIEYKLLSFTYEVLTFTWPQYLHNLICSTSSRHWFGTLHLVWLVGLRQFSAKYG